jgi:DNA polymerase delta subunit 2
VDVMPGDKDASNFTLPQQPGHRALLPKTARFTSFRPVTNPHEVDLHGVRLLGCSGQSVADVMRYSKTALPLPESGAPIDYPALLAASDRSEAPALTEHDCLRSLYEWGHIAPTAPDTLGGFDCCTAWCVPVTCVFASGCSLLPLL